MGFNDLALVSPRDPKVLQRQKVIQRNANERALVSDIRCDE